MPDLFFTQKMLPYFSEIDPKHIPEQIQTLLATNRAEIAKLLAQPGPLTWENLLEPIEDLQDNLNKNWSPINHLHSVTETEALRKAYNDILPALTEYGTELSQNTKLYEATKQIATSAAFAHLHPAQQKTIENDLRDFKLAGVQLPPDKKARLAELQQQLSAASTKFSENILDATQGWHLHVTDEKELAGLPEQSLQLAKEQAEQRGLNGYVLTLDHASYLPALQFLHNRTIRKTIYEAHCTRASECGPNAHKWDNTAVMETILKIRHEIANLIGYKNYAEYSLATKMAHSPQEVLAFLHDLVRRSKPMAETELQAVTTLASADGITSFEIWDLPYYSEKLRLAEFDFSQEDLRPYFPAEQVLQGMFAFVNKLYGITIRKQADINVWHPDAAFFNVYDAQGNLRGGFYTDLYARQHKREGAWMDDCRIRRRKQNGDIQHPVAYLTCNFMPPVNNQPALLTHDDVLTLFHEFGHCLHHLLTLVDYPSVAGINGVPWDAVEFPSQFMENFCWEKESLALIAAHYQTKAPLPDDLHKKMIRAKNFQTAMHMLRQLEFALFDLRLHTEYDPNKPHSQIQEILNEVRKEVSVVPTPAYNRFQHSFSHIFAGGYAAGYYSYKWAEVLSADAYSMFIENGILDKTTGQSFMQNILEIGGVREPMDSFVAFRGRKPQIDALLRLSGITL